MWKEVFGNRATVLRAGVLWAATSLFVLMLPAQQAHWRNLQRKCSPSIVLVVSSENLDKGFSSGFFISSKGQIATVLSNPAEQRSLLARRADGSFLKTRVIKSSFQHQFVILQASLALSSSLRLGDSNRVKVGDPVGILGHTSGGRLEMRLGTVAQIQRTSNGLKVIHLSPPPETLLSGAPVFNRRNEVIGVVARFTGKPSVGALPIGYLKTLLASRLTGSTAPSARPAASPTTEQELPLWQKLQPVVQQARLIPDLSARIEALAALARVAMQGGLTDKAQVLFQEAIGIADKLQDAEESSFALKRVSLQLILINQWEKAVQLAHQIPDALQRATTLCELSKHAARSGQPEQALTISRQIEDMHYRCEALVAAAVAFHHQAQQNTSSPESGSGEAIPSEGQATAPSHCAALLQEAHQFAQQVASERLQVACMATVAAGMLATGATETGDALLEEALRLAQRLDALSAESARYDAAMALLEYQQWEKASALLNQLPAGRQDTARVKLVEVLIRLGLSDQVEAHIGRIRDRQKQALARLLLVRHLLQDRQHEPARACVETIPVSVERVQALTLLALAESRDGQAEMAMQSLQQAEETTKRLSDPRQHPEAIATIAAAYAQYGDPSKAENLFQEAFEAAKMLGEPWASSLQSRILLLKAEAIQATAANSPPTAPSTLR